MSKKANKTLIGAFVIGAVFLLIIAIIVFGSGTLFRRTNRYVLFFDGSIKGLSVGAPVVLRGVKIGTVKDIHLVYDRKIEDLAIPVIIDVESSRIKNLPKKLSVYDYNELLASGLRAKLDIQSFITGQLMIALDFYTDRPGKIHDIAKQYPEIPTLPTSPDIFELMDELPIKEIADDLKEAVGGLNKLINSEGPYGLNSTLKELTQAVRSIRLLVEYLEIHPEALIKGK
ncbi:MAG: MlaD family protein [Candidatus Omnitrophica bacterium]|jgi:paraquat-inducible protein B|nr:MlaD family protein [Candidatus Omnitrophota bacterium]MDD5253190.1 MlaD family protein [Candidatus Omnitrophota bacterium]